VETNAYAFLNIEHPVCAWAAYRGVLYPTPKDPGYISIWTASHLKGQKIEWLKMEMQLDRVRNEVCPERVSRIRGLFCFKEKGSAELALKWPAKHFHSEFWAELHIENDVSKDSRQDGNWITAAQSDTAPEDWMYRYWSGEPYPGSDPIWEYLFDSRAFILGTEIREKARELLRRVFPNSLKTLELSRLAALCDRGFGNISFFIQQSAVYSDHIAGHYLIDFRGPGDPAFNADIEKLCRSGHPVMPEYWMSEEGEVLPDLRPFGFSLKKSDYPFIIPSPS